MLHKRIEPSTMKYFNILVKKKKRIYCSIHIDHKFIEIIQYLTKDFCQMCL